MWRWARRTLLSLIGLLAVVAGCGAIYQSLATGRDLAATPSPGRLVDIGGHRLHIWCEGSGSPAVILDSGLGGTAFDWHAVQPHVSSFTQVCSYDRAGMGYSDPGPQPRTSEQIASELEKLLVRSDIKKPVILVGASFAGFNMRIFASKHPDRVAGLVLVDASHEDQGARYAQAGAPEKAPAYAGLVPIAASVGILRLLNVTLGPPPELAAPSVRPFVRATAFRSSRYHTMVSELMHARQSGAQVKTTRRQLAIPLVVLSPRQRVGPIGEVDRALQADLVTLSTRACRMVAERSGHVIANDQPEAVVRAIRATLDAAKTNTRPDC